MRLELFLEWVRKEVGGYAGMSPPVALSVQLMISPESASQEEHNGTNFSFVAFSSEELNAERNLSKTPYYSPWFLARY